MNLLPTSLPTIILTTKELTTMAYNRLKLDFSIEYIDDRINFVQNYVNQE